MPRENVGTVDSTTADIYQMGATIEEAADRERWLIST